MAAQAALESATARVRKRAQQLADRPGAAIGFRLWRVYVGGCVYIHVHVHGARECMCGGQCKVPAIGAGRVPGLSDYCCMCVCVPDGSGGMADDVLDAAVPVVGT